MGTIAMILYDGVLSLDVSGPLDVFAMANRGLPSDRQYKIITISAESGLLRASNGLQLKADCSIANAPSEIDLLLVPGGPGAYDRRHSQISSWIKANSHNIPRCGAICTGAFILAETGLLDDHRCTTHWKYTERLAKQFPRINVESNELIVMDRKNITSGGVTAGIDMALAIVAEDHGKSIALEVAKSLLVAMNRQGNQAHYVPLLATVVREGSAIAKVRSHISDNLEKTHSVASLAELAAMSPRNLARVFLQETGATPMTYLQNLRLEKAKKLLEETNLSLKSVAYNSGFTDSRHLRVVFVDKFGVAPTSYRQQYGAKSG